MQTRRKVLVVGIAALVLAAVPHSRNVLVLQVRQVTEGVFNPGYWGFSPYKLTFYGIVPRGYGVAERDRRPIPRSAAEALAMAVRNTDKKGDLAYRDMMHAYPKEPALCARLLCYYARHWPRRPVREIGTPVSWTPLPDGPPARRAKEAIQMGRRLDPDNMYFDLFDATLRFIQGRDAEALAAMHRAAGKKHYNSYARDEAVALVASQRRKIVPLNWLDPMVKVVWYCQTASLESSGSTTARIAGKYARQAAKQGETARALVIMADLVRIGGVMRDESPSLIEALMGCGIQTRTVGDVHQGLTRSNPSNRPVAGPSRASQTLAELRRLVRLHLRSAQWDHLQREITRSEDLMSRAKTYSRRMPSALAYLSAVVLWGTADYLLFHSLVLGLIWLAAFVWVKRRVHVDIAGAGPKRLAIWMLAVLPPVAVLVIAGFIQHWFLPTALLSGGAVWRLPPAGTYAWLIPALVVLIAALRTRASGLPMVGRMDTFFARLRRASVLAIQGLLILYFLAMVGFLVSNSMAHRYLDEKVNNEVRVVWHFAPFRD